MAPTKVNTLTLFAVGIIMGVVVTLSIMAHMGGAGVDPAPMLGQGQVQAQHGHWDVSVTSSGAGRDSALQHQTDPSVEQWADEAINAISTSSRGPASSSSSSTSRTASAFTSNQGQGQRQQAAYNPGASFVGGGLAAARVSRPASSSSGAVTGSALGTDTASKKETTPEPEPVSPLEAVAKSISYVPGSSGELPRYEQQAEAASKSLSAAGALKSGAANEQATSTPTTSTGRSGVAHNFDTKTDGRGRDPSDDVIDTGSKGTATTSSGSSSSSGLVEYHEQARALPLPSASIEVSVQTLVARGGTAPDMTEQKTSFEKENLKVHMCNAVYEAYSASYLTTRQHMIAVKSEGYNLTWVNCEMASFIHMRESRNFLVNPKGGGMIIQSLDVIDFSVIHLSAFERSSKKHKHLLWTEKKDLKSAWHNIDAVKRTAGILDNLNNPKKTKAKKIVWTEEAKRTVVIMPFLGGAMGAGHSELGNRFEYLKACFWSFYEFVPNIVAGVSRQEDVDWGMRQSGLPFYDMILVEDLPKSAGLPVGLTQQVKKRLVSGQYDFDFIFFTESDQILISRTLPLMHEHLKKWPDRMVLPHRLMPYSDRVIQEVHKRDISVITAPSRDGDKAAAVKAELAIGANDWMTQSCCLPRQNCVERKSWQPIASPAVPVINYHGLYVPLGNVNFLAESYRFCEMSAYKEICP